MAQQTDTPIQVVEISPKDVQLYKAYARPSSLRLALRRLDTIASHRQALTRMGEDEAVAGATIELRHALLDALAVPPADFAGMLAKTRAVSRYFDLCDPAWLLEMMMGVATRVEWQLLDLRPEQIHQIHLAAPFSRIEQ